MYVLILILVACAKALSAQNAPAVRVATKGELVAAMRKEKALGYNLLATANGARLSAAVLLDLARKEAETASPRPVLLPHKAYFEAYIDVTGVERAAAPEFVRIAEQYGEDHYLDCRREKVVEKVISGKEPKLALNVAAGWTAGKGVAEEYTYNDNASTPPLRVKHDRISRYRLLDFGDVILFDEISGVCGRATGGALGAMFAVIGDGRAWRSFIAISEDNWQVTLTTAKKFGLSVTQTATVSPAGKGGKGLPADRPDMKRIEDRLKQKFEARYVSMEEATPESWAAAVGRR